MQEYDYIRYKPGKINSNVVALSGNLVLLVKDQSDAYNQFIEDHYKSSKIPEIEIIKKIYSLKFLMLSFIQKILMKTMKKIQPQNKKEVKQILIENQNNSIAGHSGYLRTYRRTK